jgi:hypothetical protein
MANDATMGAEDAQDPRQFACTCDAGPIGFNPAFIPAFFVPISKEAWNFQNIEVKVTVSPAVSNAPKDYQDIIHIASRVHPSLKRCGVEIGIRDRLWVIGYNHGSADTSCGYIECHVPEAELHDHQRIIFTKIGSRMRLVVETPVTSIGSQMPDNVESTGVTTRSITWDIGTKDFQNHWLLPQVVIGVRTDGLQGDLSQAFRWRGTIHAFSVACSAIPLD